jgi:OFA family oxalate/formate antiporter-like MFS transporter
MLLYAIQAAVFFLLPRLDSVTLFTGAVAMIGLCYGGGFGTMPSFTADFFGARNMGGIYGWVLLAWGAAAIPSPLLMAYLRETTGTYTVAIRVIAFLMLACIGLPLLAKRPARQEVEQHAVAT